MLWWVYIWMQLQLIRTGVTDCPYRVNSVVHSSSEKFQKLKRCRDCALSIRETSYLNVVQFTWVQFSRSVESDSLRRHESKHARPPCPSPTPGIHPNSCPWSRWCHPAISSSVVPFSSCPQSSQHRSFPMIQLFTCGGQTTGISALASALPKLGHRSGKAYMKWNLLMTHFENLYLFGCTGPSLWEVGSSVILVIFRFFDCDM